MKKSSLIKLCVIAFSLAQLVSIFGDRLNQFSVVGMIGKVERGSSFELMKLALFTYLPVLLAGPLFGSLIDRFNKAAVLILSDFFRGLLVLVLPSLYMATGSLYAFYVPILLLSVTNMFFAPAKSAIIPAIVDRNRLVQVNALLWSIGIIGTLAGFLFGGWLFDYRSWQLSFYADGLSYILSVILLLPLLCIPAAAGRGSVYFCRSGSANPLNLIKVFLHSIKEGVLIIGENKIIGTSLVVQAILFGLGGIIYVICVSLVQEVSPENNAFYLAITAAASTMGLLAGSLLSVLSKNRLAGHRVLSIATVLGGTALIGIAKSETVEALAIWAAVLGAAMSPAIILTETSLQKHIPEKFRGRVFSTREVLTKTSFLGLTVLATAVNALVSKEVILISIGLFLAMLGMILERKKLLLLDYNT